MLPWKPIFRHNVLVLVFSNSDPYHFHGPYNTSWWSPSVDNRSLEDNQLNHAIYKVRNFKWFLMHHTLTKAMNCPQCKTHTENYICWFTIDIQTHWVKELWFRQKWQHKIKTVWSVWLINFCNLTLRTTWSTEGVHAEK